MNISRNASELSLTVTIISRRRRGMGEVMTMKGKCFVCGVVNAVENVIKLHIVAGAYNGKYRGLNDRQITLCRNCYIDFMHNSFTPWLDKELDKMTTNQ
jgi:hypothetical protein